MLGIDGVKMRENRVWDAFFWVFKCKKIHAGHYAGKSMLLCKILNF